MEIEDKLADLVPETVYEACTLLRFAAEMVERDCVREGGIVSMIKNAEAGLCTALRGEDAATRENLKAERAKGFAEGRDYCRQMFTNASLILDERKRVGQEGLP